MKKIALAAAAMGGTALLVYGASGTFAAFSDSETISGQRAGADTFLLEVGGGVVNTGNAHLALAPGESAQYAYEVTNDSDLPGLLSATVAIEDVENGRNAPERAAGDTNDSTGEFSTFARVLPAYDQNCDGVGDQELTTAPIAFADLATTVSDRFGAWTFAANSTHCVVLDVTLPDVPDINQVQGDDMIFSLGFTLTQDVQGARG
jgi:predicted ribosomally synthesized peptide with SipW-like signal peptide